MTSRFLPLALSAALAGTAFFAAPANAEIQRNVQLDIQYDTNALATASGAETVLESLQEQALQACRYAQPIAGAPRVDDDCVAEVVGQAVTLIDAPELTRVYAARTSEPTRFLASLK